MLDGSETGLASSMISTQQFWPETLSLEGRVRSMPVECTGMALLGWSGGNGLSWRSGLLR